MTDTNFSTKNLTMTYFILQFGWFYAHFFDFENLALIEQKHIDFDDRFNVITGRNRCRQVTDFRCIIAVCR